MQKEGKGKRQTMQQSGIIISSVAPMSDLPVSGQEMTDEVLHGQTVNILERKDTFCFVTTEPRYSGWIPETTVMSYTKGSVTATHRVLRSFLDVKKEARVQAPTILTLPRGAKIRTLGTMEDGWQKICLADEREGFVRGSGIMELCQVPWQSRDQNELREALAKTALLYLGCQYRWGGKTPAGVDCSGLVSVSYLQQGIIIWRDAALKEGFPVREIRLEQIEKGDLLFFPGHIAMYLGEGRYIHSTAAAGSDGVVLNSLNPADPDYREDLLKKITHVGSIFH